MSNANSEKTSIHICMKRLARLATNIHFALFMRYRELDRGFFSNYEYLVTFTYLLFAAFKRERINKAKVHHRSSHAATQEAKSPELLMPILFR